MTVLVGWNVSAAAKGNLIGTTPTGAIKARYGSGAGGRANGTPATVTFIYDGSFNTSGASFRIMLYEQSTRDLVAYTDVIDNGTISTDVEVTKSVTAVKDVSSSLSYIAALEGDITGNNCHLRESSDTLDANGGTVEEGGSTSGYSQDLTAAPPNPLPAFDGATGANQASFYMWFESGATPTINSINQGATINQADTFNVTVSDWTEQLGTATYESQSLTIVDGDAPSGTVTLKAPVGIGLSDTTGGTLVLNGTGTESASGTQDYNETHPTAAPTTTTPDSNSIINGQSYPDGSYWRIVTQFSHMALPDGADLAQDINDIVTNKEVGYTGDDTATLEFLAPDATTSQLTVEVEINESGVVVLGGLKFARGIGRGLSRNLSRTLVS